MEKKVRTGEIESAREVTVIETKFLRGFGTKEDICRVVRQYWDMDGNLLAENDPVVTEMKN